MSIMQKIILNYYRNFRFRETEDITFPDFAENIKKILIVLPSDSIKKEMDLANKAFGETYDVHFASFVEKGQECDKKGFFNLKKVLFSMVPGGEGFKALKDMKFDLFIDTNSTFDSGSALVGLLCGIHKRVGFSDEYEKPFYNMIFKGDSISEFSSFMEGLKN